MSSGIEIFQTWLVALFTLALFSFLYKDNPVYKLAEHIFAGLTAGYQVGLVWDTVVLQKLWDPMIYDSKWWLFIPGILGFLMFSRFTSKYTWISRMPLAFVMGTTSGVFLTTQLHGLVLPAMKSTMLPLGGGGGLAAALLAVVVVVGVISTLIYFYFSKEHTGALGVTAKVGIWFIMVAFGAHFGYTVMGRISLLIGRTQFLVNDWIGSFSQIF
ncbi:MAG: hypothetical protein U9N55_06805 [candidate division Zixibacteria bacterium]|nr:hypothetical protein [candidate division Zixibacteria bacterium]